MKKFAKEHNLNPSIFFNIIVGKTRYSNGWSLFTGDYIKPLEKNAKEYNVTLISPDGEEFSNIRNLTKFCKEKKISISSIRELINGKIKKKSYKGWKLKNKK
jgi:K+-sensing histidine kinase KdpD